MRLLVAGAGGMLASDVVRAAAAHEVVALTIDELDVTDARAVERAVRAHRPDAIVNCAGYTDVDGAESDEEAATAVNARAAGHLARGAAAVGATVVYPSTDYVFDGTKRTPYVESDTPSPRSAYGRSKLAGERATQAAPRHLVARISWLFGRFGRNFVETMLSAAERGPLRVVDDQVGSPTYAGHLAAAIVEMLETGVTGTAHVAGGGECSWYGFARAIFDGAGVDADLAPCTTDELRRPAPRPAYSVLRSGRSDVPKLPPWQDGLAAYIRERVTA